MASEEAGRGPSWFRNYRGNRNTSVQAYRRYDFPVTVRRVGDEPSETTDQ